MSELRAWLDKLGALSADEIRKLMQDEGVKGVREESRRCPIANFLTSKMSGTRVSVGYHWTYQGGQGVVADCVTPCSVSEFAAKFDGDCYPELVCDE